MMMTRLLRAVSKRTFHAGKFLYQHARAPGAPPGNKRLLFILGCQRSGTTLMQRIFEADLDAAVYGEFSRITLTGKTANARLRPLDEVAAILARERARLVVAKPIVETQNALKLLGYFPGSKVLFLYRHYAAVAASNLKLFGRQNGINNLRPIVQGEAGNWRSEGVPPEIRAQVAARFSEDMDAYDAAALFWYVRNRFFFDLGLDRHPAVLPLRYEDLLAYPALRTEGVYRFLAAQPSRRGVPLVRAESSGGRGVKLSPDIERLCVELLARLDRANARAWDGFQAASSAPGLRAA